MEKSKIVALLRHYTFEQLIHKTINERDVSVFLVTLFVTNGFKSFNIHFYLFMNLGEMPKEGAREKNRLEHYTAVHL